MPRKTPVREIQEENTSEGSLRRSSRIAQNIVVPTKITQRRNSANDEMPAKITKTKRLSFSQENVSEFAENKPSVETNVSTPKKTRLTRSASKSPTFVKEIETKSTPAKTRGRRGSLSKGIEEEEVNSSTPKKTRSRSIRSESKSPLTVSDSEHVRLRTRKGSITDNITPLEKIEEVNQPTTEPKKRLKSRRSSVNEMSQLEVIDETETDKKEDKKLELEAISEITENEKETTLEDANRELETVSNTNKTSISQSINKLKLSPIVVIQKDKTITDLTVNQKLKKNDVKVVKETKADTDDTEKPDTDKTCELSPVKVLEQLKCSNYSAESKIISEEENSKLLESEINSKIEKDNNFEENKNDTNLTKISKEKTSHSKEEYGNSSELLVKITKKTIPENIASEEMIPENIASEEMIPENVALEETNFLQNTDIVEKLSKVDIKSENIKSNNTEETKTVLKETTDNKNTDGDLNLLTATDTTEKQNKGRSDLNIEKENSKKNEIDIKSTNLLLNTNPAQNNELEKREPLFNEEVITKKNADDKKIDRANVDEEMNIVSDTNVTDKGNETKIINKNEIKNVREKDQGNNDVLKENVDNNEINVKSKNEDTNLSLNTNFKEKQNETTILDKNESDGEKLKNEINLSKEPEKDRCSEAKSEGTVEKIDHISQTSPKVLKQISTERVVLAKNFNNEEEDNSELKFRTSEVDYTNKSLSNLLPNQLDMTSGSDGSFHINLSLQSAQDLSSLKLSNNVEIELNKSDGSDKENNQAVEGVKEGTPKSEPLHERKISPEDISQKKVENNEILYKSSQDSFYEPMDVDYPSLSLVDDLKNKSFSSNIEGCSTPTKEIHKSTDLSDCLSIQDKSDISDVHLENINKAITDNKKLTDEISASRSDEDLNLKETSVKKESVENKLKGTTEKIKLVNDVTENQMCSTKKSEEIAINRVSEEIILSNEDSLNKSLPKNKEENIKDYDSPVLSIDNVQNILSNEDSLNKSRLENEENIKDCGSPVFSIHATDISDEDIDISTADGTVCKEGVEKHHHTSCDNSINSTSTTPNYVCKENEEHSINISEETELLKLKSSSTTKNDEENNGAVEQITKKNSGTNDNREDVTDVELEKPKRHFTESKRISNFKKENEKTTITEKEVNLKTDSVESKEKEHYKDKNKSKINHEESIEIESFINVEAEKDIDYKIIDTSKTNFRKSETKNMITEEAEENKIVSTSKIDLQKPENENFELLNETTVNTEEPYEVSSTNVELNKLSKRSSNPKRDILSSTIIETEINNSEKYTEKHATKTVKEFNSISEDEENNKSEEVNEFIDDMAEEVEDEETPSEDSNNIICEGESINSSDTNTENDDSYEKNSFIDDEEDNFELLSGEEDFLEDDSLHNLKRSEIKQKTVNQEKETKKRRRIFTLSDSEDGEQLSNENLPKNSNTKSTHTSKEISTAETKVKRKPIENRAETKLPQAKVSKEVTNDFKHVSDIVYKNKTNIPVDLVPSRDDIIHVRNSDSESSESTNEDSELDKNSDSLMANDSRRKSSITIQENIKLEDIQDGELSERISKVVDWFYTGIKNSNDKGNISLNVSLDYANQAPNEEGISKDENAHKKENIPDPSEVSIKRKSDENVENECPKKAKFEENDDVFIDSPGVSKEYDDVFIDSPGVSKEYDEKPAKIDKYKSLQKFKEWKNEELSSEKHPLHINETNKTIKTKTIKSKRLSGEKIKHLSPKKVKYDSKQSKDFNIKLSKPFHFIVESVSSKKIGKKHKKPKIDVTDTFQVIKKNEPKQIKKKQKKSEKFDEFDHTEMPDVKSDERKLKMKKRSKAINDDITKASAVKMKNIKIRKGVVSSNKDDIKKMSELNNEINKQKNQKDTKISLYTSKGADKIPSSSGALERHFVHNTVTTKREIEEVDQKRKKHMQKASRKILPSKNSKLSNSWETDDFCVNPSKSNKKSDSSTLKKNKTETDSFNFKDFKNRMLYDTSRIKRMDTKILLRQRKNI